MTKAQTIRNREIEEGKAQVARYGVDHRGIVSHRTIERIAFLESLTDAETERFAPQLPSSVSGHIAAFEDLKEDVTEYRKRITKAAGL